MGENTKIQWAHHTFNPWVGCEKVSPACDNCYAEAQAKRAGWPVWGHDADRRRTREAYWREPARWNRMALEAGQRHRVFCASMADVGERRRDLDPIRLDLAALIRSTPALDWLLLTKRTATFGTTLETMFAGERSIPSNVWAGGTVEDDAHARLRVPEILRVPAMTRFLSLEPVLGDIAGALYPWLKPHRAVPSCGPGCDACMLRITHGISLIARIDWIIVGGESGPHARSCDIEQVRRLVEIARATGTKVFVKQLGRVPVGMTAADMDGRVIKPWSRGLENRLRLHLADAHGGDWAEWPEDLRVREVPVGRS